MAKGGASRFFVWVILGLLIVGLAGFGATNFGGGVRSVGSVGSTSIDLDRYARELQQELRALSAEQGRTVSLSEAQMMGVPQAVLGRMVGLTALEDEAASIGLSVGDEAVRAQILDIPAFRGVDGTFDRESYRFMLEQSGLTVAEFESRVRVETAAGIVQNAVASGIGFPATFADTIFGYVRETRDVTWARLTPEALEAEAPEPTEAELVAFHAENPDLFTAPETREITYAWLTPDMLLDTVEADEDALRAVYEARIDEYVQPERRLVERLVFPTEDAAAAARARIEAGEIDFDALVAERGLTLDDVDLGDVAREDLGAAGEEVFALAEPGVAGPAPSSLGPALFRVNAILAPRETSFEEAREDLLPEVQMDRARRVIVDMIDDLEDRLAGGATVEDLAQETELELGQIEWHPGVTDGIAAYDTFRAAARAAEEGDFPEVLALPEGGLFSLRLDALRPPALRALDDVRDEVRAAWVAREVGRLMAEEAEAVAAQVREGREMAALRLPLGADRGVMRESFIEDAPADFVDTVFDMAPGEIRVVSDATVAWIVRLDQVTAADQSAAEAQAVKQIFLRQAAQEAAGDMLDAFTQALTTQKGVQINEAAINAVHAQFP
jgi:peptidyl-prolyl cis-trans isomerase D